MAYNALYNFGRRALRKFNKYMDILWIKTRPSVDVGETIYISGGARTGTTWLEEMLERGLRGYRSIHEPFSPIFYKEAYNVYKRVDYPTPPYMLYVYRGSENPYVTSYVERVMKGRVAGETTAKIRRTIERLGRMRAWRVIVKDINAVRALPYIADRFNAKLYILIIRNPGATIASRLHMRASQGRLPTNAELKRSIANTRAQAERIVELDQGALRVLDRIDNLVELLAVNWALDYLVPLTYAGEGRFNIVYYEDLVLDPEGELRKLFKLVGEEPIVSLDKLYRRLSATIMEKNIDPGRQLSKWRTRLPGDYIKRIFDIVHRIGVNVYEEGSDVPVSRV
ncbi:MAG: sulfotransferase [Desulfurococcales archaeon]|nr:sulfotransferase [Desulfurococcales archaeon]